MISSVLTSLFYFIVLVALLLAWVMIVMTLWLLFGPTRLIRWLILRQCHRAKEA